MILKFHTLLTIHLELFITVKQFKPTEKFVYQMEKQDKHRYFQPLICFSASRIPARLPSLRVK